MAGKRSALIVATGEYRDTRLPRLLAPGEDASALRSVLADPNIGGFDVRVALNSRVDTLRRTLEAFFADRARDDLLLVHFSGHGLKDDEGQLYLAAADTQLDRLLSTGIDAAWVNRLMGRCRSETIALFLDCCFAGAFTSGLTRRVAGDTAGVNDAFKGRGLLVIAASDAMQYSFEGGRQVGEPPEPSPFTKALVDGLATGKADRNEDGEVTINELFDFLEDRIHQTSPSQTPTKSAFNQVGDWMIARSTGLSGTKLLPESVRTQLTSDNSLDRISVLFDLRKIIDGPDARTAEAAMDAVRKLAQDDSRTVSARAQSLLDEAAIRPPPAGSQIKGSTPPVRRRRTRVAQAAVVPIPQVRDADAEGAGLHGAPVRNASFIRRFRATIATLPSSGRSAQAILAAITGLAFVSLALILAFQLPRSGPPTLRPTESTTANATAQLSGAPSATPPLIASNRLEQDEDLVIDGSRSGAGGNRLVDSAGQYRLAFVGGGDVAVQSLQTFEVRWRANVIGAVRVLMQGDGNLVIKSDTDNGLWDLAHLEAAGPYSLTLEIDGNLVIRREGNVVPIWTSQTDGGCQGSWCKPCAKYHCQTASPKADVRRQGGGG